MPLLFSIRNFSYLYFPDLNKLRFILVHQFFYYFLSHPSGIFNESYSLICINLLFKINLNSKKLYSQ